MSTVGALVMVAMAGFIGSASAGTASARLTAGHAAVRSAAAKPESDIVGSGKKVNYKPTSLKATWSGPKEQTCTAAKTSFTITNTTKASEQVTYMGSAFGPAIPAGKTLDVCAWGKGKATATFSLKANKKAKLTVTVT